MQPPIQAPENMPSMTPSMDYQRKTKKKVTGAKKEKILAECEKSLGLWFDFFGNNLNKFRNDKLFYQGEMWNSAEWSTYIELGKQPYTFNKIKPLIRQICGEQQNMQSNLSVLPVDMTKSSINNVEIMSDFMRSLAYDSHANQIYSECFLNQCIGGWGVLEVKLDYVNDMSFDQEIRISGSADPLMIAFDPNSQTPNKNDSDFQAKYEIISKEEFEAKYYSPAPVGSGMFGYGRAYVPVVDEKSVVIIDYYRRTFKKKTLVQLSNGINYKIEVLEEDIPLTLKTYKEQMRQQGIDIAPKLKETNRRKTEISYITCYKCVHHEILEVYEWPSKHMPFVFVDAMSTWQDGRQWTESLIFVARDAQKAYNYAMSEAINGLARLRHEKVWMTGLQAKGQEDWLRNPDRQQSHGEYTPDPEAPQGPIFRPPEELPSAFFEMAQRMEEDIYKTLGIFPTNRGEVPEAISGVAMGKTIMQGNLTFKKLLGNLFDGMRVVGDVILDLIPKIYDSERIVNLVDESGKSSSVQINGVKNGQPDNNIAQGLYKLQVKPIAAFAAQQEAVRTQLIQLAGINPQVAPLVLDIIASTMETPVAPRLVERFQSLVPPNILAQEQGLPPPPPPPPDPMIALTAAKTQQAQSSAALNQAKAQTEGVKVQQNQQETMMNYQLEQQKLQASRDELIAMTNKAYVDSQAEIGKAQITYETEALKSAMQHIANAGRDANAQMNNSASSTKN